MVTSLENAMPIFAGGEPVQAIAQRAFDILRARGMFMADNMPIRVRTSELTQFLGSQLGIDAADVHDAISANEHVFGLVTTDGVEYVVTTRAGRAPVQTAPMITHTFSERFLTPDPVVHPLPKPASERPRVDPSWATYTAPEAFDGDIDEVDDFVVLVEPVEAAPVDIVAEPVEVEQIVEPADIVAESVEVEPTATIAPAADQLVDEGDALSEDSVELAPAAEPLVEEVAVSVPASQVPTRSDFSMVDDDVLAAALESQLTNDPRFAVFAGDWMEESQVERLGRNDVRRIKDYISEQEQPLTDAMLVQDVLNLRPTAINFETVRFSLNYRLFRDHRDFEFVGTADQRFWSTSSLPQIGTTRRKPNEIGTDYRYLVDDASESVISRSVSSVTHTLTFYEHALGLLPYDEDLQRLLPAPVLSDQRTAVLTFEIPQLYTTYLVELRYPTPNRGGFLLGLDDFYAESLVPGALISISSTDNDGHYRVEFLPGKAHSARLLDLDDRRAPRYHFRPTSYSCEVAPEWLISEERFPRLGAEKPLDDKIRRRPDAVVEATFERIGIEDGDSLFSSFDELLTAVNIERPFSATLLRQTLESNRSISGDGDTYTYAR